MDIVSVVEIVRYGVCFNNRSIGILNIWFAAKYPSGWQYDVLSVCETIIDQMQSDNLQLLERKSISFLST